MNKHEFINEIARRSSLSSYAVAEVFRAAANVITPKIIAGEAVEVPELGTFTTVKRKKMIGHNLIGRETMELEECIYPSFRVSSSVKSRVKKGAKEGWIS